VHILESCNGLLFHSYLSLAWEYGQYSRWHNNMKQSWLTGILMAYILIMGVGMIVQAQSTPAASIVDVIKSMGMPNMVGYKSDVVSGISGALFGAGDIIRLLKGLIYMSLLYFPALFQGYYVWAWWIICMPIAVSLWIAGLLAIFRGTPSS